MTEIQPSDGFALVTGAGSGLGRALAGELVRAGFITVGTGRRLGPLQETAQQLGDRFHPCPLDVADKSAVSEQVDALVAQHGPLAILINNAAVYPRRDFLDETPDSFDETLQINLGGVINCSHAALRHMAPLGQGRILNVSTFADMHPLPCSAAYSVSKGAARILTRALIADLGDRFPGVVISDWMPGMLQTGMGIPDGLPPEVSAKWGAKLARMCDPDLTGSTFEMGAELLPPRSLKGRIKDALLLRRRKPRQL